MSDPAYPAARIVAPRVESHFASHVHADPDADGGPVPDAATIEALIDVAFWASLRREEGFSPRISLALVGPDRLPAPLRFEHQLPLAAEVLTRLAPAVERPGVHLGVWPAGGGLRIWGATRAIPPMCLVLEVVGPGLLVVKHRRRDATGKFVNVVVLEGDRVKIIDESPSSLPEFPPVVAALRGVDTPGAAYQPVNVLVRLALSMRGHGRGGILLVVPDASDDWLESLLRPVPYAVAPRYAALPERLSRLSESESPETSEALRLSIEGIAGLTAVDGATILSESLELLAFGAKIVRRSGNPQVERVSVTEPIEGVTPALVHPSQLGGTRHLAAAQFVQDQHGALALVASQDGRFTVFAWSAAEKMVHAHRVESLLL